MFNLHFENHNAGMIMFLFCRSIGSSRMVHCIGQRSLHEDLDIKEKMGFLSIITLSETRRSFLLVPHCRGRNLFGTNASKLLNYQTIKYLTISLLIPFSNVSSMIMPRYAMMSANIKRKTSYFRRESNC